MQEGAWSDAESRRKSAKYHAMLSFSESADRTIDGRRRSCSASVASASKLAGTTRAPVMVRQAQLTWSPKGFVQHKRVVTLAPCQEISAEVVDAVLLQEAQHRHAAVFDMEL